MTNASDGTTEPSCLHDDETNLLDLILVLARRWRMIAGITVLFAIASTGLAMKRPMVFTSSARLLMLEFIDQTPALRVGNDGKLVWGKHKGVWKPADASVIKQIFESAQLKQTVGSKWSGDQYRVQIIQEKQLGTITVKVEGSKPGITGKIAADTIKESAELSFRMGLLASPALALDDAPKIMDGAVMVMRLLEPPTDGAPIKPGRSKIILLSTMTGLLFSIFLAFALEWLKNLQSDDRKRWDEIKASFKR